MPSLPDPARVVARLRPLLDQALAAKAWPGGILAVVRPGLPDLILPHGYHTFTPERAVRASDFVDVASLTKVLATTAATMHALESGQLDLDAPVGHHLPEFIRAVPDQQDLRRQVTLRHLLTHTAGLPSHIPFYRTHPDVPPAERPQVVQRVPLKTPPGTEAVYSDLGLMLLGFILDQVLAPSWSRRLHQVVYAPLGMRHTRFNLPPSLRPRALPTECTAPDGAAWQGVVHDENARWLGGRAGHAGLFTTAADVCRYAHLLLARGQGPTGPVFRPETIARFTQRAGLVAASSRCLGWDSPSPGSSGGDFLSPTSFGHTGFTGTSLWIDPEARLAVSLLTNAVHPRREGRTERGFFEWRRRTHSGVYQALDLA